MTLEVVVFENSNCKRLCVPGSVNRLSPPFFLALISAGIACSGSKRQTTCNVGKLQLAFRAEDR
jgi:hypothetical protein